MPVVSNLNDPFEDALATVNKTKMLAHRLKLAIIHQDNLNKERLDRNFAEKLRLVEELKKKYMTLEKEYQVLKNEVKSAEQRLFDTSEEYRRVVDESEVLKSRETAVLNLKGKPEEEHREFQKELCAKVKFLKMLTGVRFDFNMSEDIITGYIGIVGTSSSNSGIMPFEIEKNSTGGKIILRKKINELCSDISQNEINKGI